MNERFLGLPEEKQKNIMNAAFKVFACNDYNKAPMSEIAAEGEISKALLFYYFKNKAELYMFLWEKTLEFTVLSIQEHGVMETDDFFEMLSRSAKAKCSLMRKYPYLYLFSMNAYYTQCPQVKDQVRESFESINQRSFEKVLRVIDQTKLRKDLDFKDIYKEVLLSSDGFMLQKYRSTDLDIDEIEKQYKQLISFWKKAYAG